MKNIFYLLFALWLCACGSGSSEKYSSQDFSNFVLLEIRSDINLINMLKNSEHIDTSVRKELVSSFVAKLFLLAKLNPSIEGLKGEALESMCMLGQLDYSALVLEVHDKGMLDLIDSVLSAVVESSMKKVKDTQQSLGGNGCELSP